MKKIKFLIGILSLIAVTCLFGLFNNSNSNKIYAAENPYIKLNVTNDTVTPGSTFYIEVEFSAGSVSSGTWDAFNAYIFFDPDAAFTVAEVPATTSDFGPEAGWEIFFDGVSYNDSSLNSTVKSAYQSYLVSSYIDSSNGEIGVALAGLNNCIDASDVNTIKFKIKCKVDEEVASDKTTDFDITFGGPDDFISNISIDFVEYSYYGAPLGGLDSVQTFPMAIKDKSRNSIFDTVNITGGDGESWTFCDTDDDINNNTAEMLVGKTLDVAATTSSVSLSATAQELGTILSVSPGNGSNGSYNIPLAAPGENTDVTVKILAEKASDYMVGSDEYNALIKEYTFTIARAKYDVKTLDGLQFSLVSGEKGDISLAPSFTSDNATYTLTLPDERDVIVVKPIVTPNVYIKEVKFGTQTLSSGSNNNITITGLSEIVITVVAQNGDEGTYTVTLDRKSNDNSLKETPVATLITSDGDKTLSLTNTGDNYTAEVDYTNTLGFSITATQNDSLASIVFDPTSKEISFSNGYGEESKTITITVTSQSGIDREFKVIVKRLKADENVDINYVIKGKTTQTVYTPTITGDKWIYELPASEEKAVVSYDGLSDTTTASGSAISSTLEFSATYYTLTVTPENPNKAKSYEIYITKAKDTSNTITDIKILTEANGTAVEGIDYTFTKSETDQTYNFTVPYTVSSIYFQVTYPTSASISVSGNQSLNKTGANDPNKFVVFATSESDVAGVKYTFNIIRISADKDNTLSSLKINGVEYINEGVLTTTEICLDRNTQSIIVEAVKNSEFATIDTDDSTLGEITLSPGGVYTVKVIVLSQEPKQKTYEIKVHTKEQLNTITGITLEGILMDGNPYTINYTFASGVQPDNITVPYKVSSVQFTVTTNATDGLYTCSVNDPIALPIDLNKPIKVAITSEYGKEGDAYNFNITRGPANKDCQLESLSLVIDGKEYIKDVEGVEFDVTGTKTTIVKIPNTVDLSTITKGFFTAKLPENSLATILSGNGEFELKKENFNHQIIVLAEDPQVTKTYNILFQIEGQKLSDNNKLTEIKLLGGTDNKNFLEGVTLEDIEAAGPSGYKITIPYNITMLNPVATPESNLASVEGISEPYLFNNEGDYQLICIYGVAENKEPGIHYYIHVTRDTSSKDAYLTELIVGDQVFNNPNPDEDIIVRVDHDVESIKLNATPCDKATIKDKDLETKILKPGIQAFTITVYAEDTSISETYNITVYRAENDATITNITISNVEYVFDPLITIIPIELPYTTTSITFNVTSTATYATGIGKFIYELDNTTVGSAKEIIIQVKSEYYVSNPEAEDAAISKEYKFLVSRKERNTNVYLSNLEVKVGNDVLVFDNPFDKDDTAYIVENLDKSVHQVYINAIAEAKTSKVTGDKNVTLDSGSIIDSNSFFFEVLVTAESVPGDIEIVKKYTITISRSEVDLSNIKEVTSITIKGNDGNIYFQSQFNFGVDLYEIDVPYEVSSVYVNATFKGKSIEGLDVYNIEEGETITVVVFAVSEKGEAGTKYNIKITRAAADHDSTLEFIKINGALIERFSPTNITYNKFVLYSTSSVDLTVKPTKNTSTVRITVDNLPHNGLNISLQPDTQTTVNILVVAQNGHITPYTVNITRASADGTLNDLYIEETNFHDENGIAVTFNPAIKKYYATVSYAYEFVTIYGKSEDVTIEVRGIGRVSLVVGRQEFQIAAIPKTGNVTVYTIEIIRKAEATNSTNVGELSILEIPTFKTDFTNSLNFYEGYSVSSSIKNLTFDIVFDVSEFEDSPSYEIINNNLYFGFNAVVLLITSPDLSTTRTIIIQVERCDVEVASVNINEIAAFSSEFTNDDSNYSYKVKGGINELNISLALVDSENNSYEISDTKLKDGNNTITITLKTGDEVNKVIYLNVYREASSNVLDYFIAVGCAVILISCFFVFRKKKGKI